MNAMFALGILCLVPLAYSLRDSTYTVELLVESLPGANPNPNPNPNPNMLLTLLAGKRYLFAPRLAVPRGVPSVARTP
jgi:hypothetical protein